MSPVLNGVLNFFSPFLQCSNLFQGIPVRQQYIHPLGRLFNIENIRLVESSCLEDSAHGNWSLCQLLCSHADRAKQEMSFCWKACFKRTTKSTAMEELNSHTTTKEQESPI